MITRKEKLLENMEMVFKEVETDFIKLHAAASLYLRNSEATKEDKAELWRVLNEFEENYLK